MDLKKFRETLLEFLSEVTVIPEKNKELFIESGLEHFPILAPNNFCVLGSKILIGRSPEIESEDEVWFAIRLFTADHKYSISAVYRGNDSYLGCTASTRKPRTGEDWTRGNDLPDGKFNKETWSHIKTGIIKYELKYLSKYITGGHWNNPQVEVENQPDKQ